MATIYQLPTPIPATVGVFPTKKFALFGDNLSTVTTAGYLNSVNLESAPIAPTDIIEAFYSYNPVSASGTYALFTCAVSTTGTITLSQASLTGDVTLPTIANNLIVSTNTIGGLANQTGTAINAGSLQAGSSGTAGTLISYPATSAKGDLIVAAVANTGNTSTTISNAAMGQATVVSIPDPGASTANFIMSGSASAATQHITSGGLAIDAGALVSGIATGGQVGTLTLYPTTAAKGSLSLNSIANTGNTATIIQNAAFGQATTLTINDPATATANFLIAPSALVSGNFVEASGTAGLIIDAGVSVASVSSVITQVGALYQVAITLNTAAVAAAYANPAQIVANPSASQVIIVHSANVYTASTGNTAFSTGTAPIIQYSTGGTNGAHGAGTIATAAGLVAGDITAATSQVRNLFGFATAALTGLSGKGIYFSNATGAYTAGTGTSVTITLVYELISATI